MSGRVLTAPVQRETLIPAGLVLASSRDADLVELPVQVDPGDMAQPDGDTRRVLAAVWGPKGGPGRTTVAVNLAFEAAAAGGEVLLGDADTYGGAVAHANRHTSQRI